MITSILALAVVLPSVFAGAETYLGPGIRYHHFRYSEYDSCVRIRCEQRSEDGKCEKLRYEFAQPRTESFASPKQAKRSRELRRELDSELGIRTDSRSSQDLAWSTFENHWDHLLKGRDPLIFGATMLDVQRLLIDYLRYEKRPADRAGLLPFTRIFSALFEQPTNLAGCEGALSVDSKDGEIIHQVFQVQFRNSIFRELEWDLARMANNLRTTAEPPAVVATRGLKQGAGLRTKEDHLLYAECRQQTARGCESLQFYRFPHASEVLPHFLFTTINYAVGAAIAKTGVPISAPIENAGASALGRPISGEELLTILVRAETEFGTRSATVELLRSLQTRENYNLDARSFSVSERKLVKIEQWLEDAIEKLR